MRDFKCAVALCTHQNTTDFRGDRSYETVNGLQTSSTMLYQTEAREQQVVGGGMLKPGFALNTLKLLVHSR